jgi:hypothetical protein
VCAYHLDLALEVTEEQRLLNGARYLTLEGESSGQGEAWSAVLNFGQPKEPGAPLLEADLNLSRGDAEVFASLVEGRVEPAAEDLSGADGESVELLLRIEGGEGGFSSALGSIRLAGMLSAGRAALRADVDIEETTEELNADGCD